MKKLLAFLFAVSLIFAAVGSASASPITLGENFYGAPDDDNYLTLFEYGWPIPNSVTLSFDLTDYNTGNPLPTTDETGYDPLSLNIISGELEFTFSSEDAVGETVEIWTGFYDGDQLLAEETYNLGYWVEGHWEYWGPKWWQRYWVPGYSVREYASLNIDLGQAGVLSYLQDGLLDTIVLVPFEFDLVVNDIRLDQAGLVASAVPEPATMLLLGSGLIGLAGIGRKKFRK